MVLKTKLSLGIGFLFLIILTLVGFCSYYVGTLAREAENILKDNYNSIAYAKNMTSALDDMRTSISGIMLNPADTGPSGDYYRQLFESGKKEFDTNLRAESNNITEIHENEYVARLTQDYHTYLRLCSKMKKGSGGRSVYFKDFLPANEKLKQSIDAIYDINMQAVVRKVQLTKKDSATFMTSMSIIGAFCILLALGYFWYFPVYISTTLGYLSNRMKNLLKNIGAPPVEYTNDEAFVILRGLDLLENKLGVKKEDNNPGRSGVP
jgi:hypothetical protein